MPSEWKFFLHSWIFKVHSKNSDCIWVHSKYLGPFLWPATFWSLLKENRNGKPLKILPECPECASNELECTLNAFRLLPESISILKEFSWNSTQMSSKSFACGSNAVGTSRLALEWVRTLFRTLAESHIQECVKNFPFRRHSQRCQVLLFCSI